jgi:hypothetical protein
MALDFSGLDTQAHVNNLIAKYHDLGTEYAALTNSAAVSDQGRSIDSGKTAESILKQMEAIRMELARIAGSAFVTSRTRA